MARRCTPHARRCAVRRESGDRLAGVHSARPEMHRRGSRRRRRAAGVLRTPGDGPAPSGMVASLAPSTPHAGDVPVTRSVRNSGTPCTPLARGCTGAQCPAGEGGQLHSACPETCRLLTGWPASWGGILCALGSGLLLARSGRTALRTSGDAPSARRIRRLGSRFLRAPGDVPITTTVGGIISGCAPNARRCAEVPGLGGSPAPADSARPEMYRSASSIRPTPPSPLRMPGDVPITVQFVIIDRPNPLHAEMCR